MALAINGLPGRLLPKRYSNERLLWSTERPTADRQLSAKPSRSRGGRGPPILAAQAKRFICRRRK